MIVTVTVSGSDSVIRLFNNIRTQMLPRVVVPELKEFANDLAEEMKIRMHKRSGDMMNSTRVINTSATRLNVVVGVSYGEEENARPGLKMKNSQGSGQGTPHRFVEPSMELINKLRLSPFLQRLENFLRTA